MQRLRETFLKRRKAVVNNFGVFVWVNLILLMCYICQGDGSGVVSDIVCWCEAGNSLQGILSRNQCPSDNTCLEFSEWNTYTDADTKGYKTDLRSQEDHKDFSRSFNEKLDMQNYGSREGQEKDHGKNVMLLGYDEFKHKAVSPKNKSAVGQNGTVKHRVDPSGAAYNYASASKGAKVLAFNKEAKGASHILDKDEDKYLRNPCSAEGKFVVIELSEETLVVTVEIANLEHYSSNFKDFELLGSSVYPTETWKKLGNFSAKNIKQHQRFTLPEPEWVRYLKLKLLSHHGSEFYCTVSLVQVYGIDAVERMLEDLITVQADLSSISESKKEQSLGPLQPISSQSDNSLIEEDFQFAKEGPELKLDVSMNDKADQSVDRQPPPIGRMPGDTVLKILMQKVQSLDLNLSILERYLEELNSRYRDIFKDVDKEIAEKDALIEKLRSDFVNLTDSNEVMVKDVSELIAWKSLVSLHMDDLKRENAILRLEVERVLEDQMHMENKGIVVLLLSLICSLFAIIKLTVHFVLRRYSKEQNIENVYGSDGPWLLLLAGSSLIVVLLLL